MSIIFQKFPENKIEQTFCFPLRKKKYETISAVSKVYMLSVAFAKVFLRDWVNMTLKGSDAHGENRLFEFSKPAKQDLFISIS